MSNRVDFEDIEKYLPGGQNMGGLPQVVYYGNYDDVAKWPERSAYGAGMSLSQLGELSGNLEMKPGKYMHRLYVTDGEGKLDIEGVGEVDGRSYVMKLRVYQPGLQSRLLGFINVVKNGNLVFIVPDSNGGFFLLGDEKRSAVLDSIDGMTTGQKTEERPGAGLVFAYKTANVYRYKGTIPLQDGGGVVPEPDPDPEPKPDMVMACCPDGINDYLSVDVNALNKIALMPVSKGQKVVYDLNLVPNGLVFTFSSVNNFMLAFMVTGTGFATLLYAGGKGYMVNEQVETDYTGQRINVRIELSLTDSGPVMKLFLNNQEIPCRLVESEVVTAPTDDSYLIFHDGSDVFSETILFSFSIRKANDGITFTDSALWNFEGETDGDKLANKVSASAFGLTAHNVTEMSEFIKKIPL